MAKTLIERISDHQRKRRAEKADRERLRSFTDNEALLAIKPRSGYVFHDDYLEIDGGVMTILCLAHNAASTDDFGPFWGINLIPVGLPASVTVLNIEQVSRMSDKWIQDRQSNAESAANKNAEQQTIGGTNNTKAKAGKALDDLAIISEELAGGASYLYVQMRLLVKAPDVKTLDFAVDRIEAFYADAHRFSTIRPATYDGAMREELSNLLRPNQMKRGHGIYFTSTEYAGEYNLVTHGLEDPDGEYVGRMIGDVNNAAVLLDTDGYDHHVVIASAQFDTRRIQGKRIAISDMWASKLSQSALLDGHRVTHILLGNDGELSMPGAPLMSVTRRINMNKGAVNMFEVFGEHGTELSAFPRQMEKLRIMTEQTMELTDHDKSVVEGSLEQIATRFYRYSGMWPENAKAHVDRIRVLGLPHDQYPLLQTFVSYIDQARQAVVNASSRDEQELQALTSLSMTYHNMLTNRGYLFNQYTDEHIEDAMRSRRTVFDFTGLMEIGAGVAMSQLVNVIDIAISNLGEGDVLIIQSAQNILPAVQDYVLVQLERLYRRGGRIVFAYDTVEDMIDSREFNHFDEANYTLLGNMRDPTMQRYQAALGRELPPNLASLVVDKSADIIYCRRQYDNVVFQPDLRLEANEGSHIRQGAQLL